MGFDLYGNKIPNMEILKGGKVLGIVQGSISYSASYILIEKDGALNGMVGRKAGQMNLPDHEVRKELRKLFGLPPNYIPDSTGLHKINGLLKDVAGTQKFDAEDFLEESSEC